MTITPARRMLSTLVALTVGFSMLVAATPNLSAHATTNEERAKRRRTYTLTLLHNNDAESQLVDAGSGLEEFGGVARFATRVRQEKRKARKGKNRGVLMLSSGDNFLAGPEFNASLEDNTFYDAVALNNIGYDAIAIGNHEFDFGPRLLARFIRAFDDPVPFLSANLNFREEPALQRLVERGRIAKSVVVREDDERFGIIGATTPLLADISSPRNVDVNPAVAEAVQRQVNKLEGRGVNKIILISHLQAIDEDLALAPELSGVDIMVAGGGDELLANEGDFWFLETAQRRTRYLDRIRSSLPTQTGGRYP